MGMREQIVKALVGKAAAPLAGKVGGPWEGGIRAYHSSPHDFDKVDFSKLRTGEGANAYGAGHYMAENPAVSGQGGQYWNNFADRFTGGDPTAVHAMHVMGANKGDRAAAIADMERILRDKPEGYSPERITKVRDFLASGGHYGPRTYEMNLRARPEELLDWDKPMREQSKLVQDYAKHGQGYDIDTLPWKGADFYTQLGRDALHEAKIDAGGRGGIGYDYRGVYPAASERLRDAGIPGIRYLDEGSRSLGPLNLARLQKDLQAAEAELVKYPQMKWANDDVARYRAALAENEAKLANPTYNYVGTDPSRLDVLAKYGVAGAAAGPALGAFTDQSQYEAAR